MMSYNTNILQPVILFECSEVCSLEIESCSIPSNLLPVSCMVS